MANVADAPWMARDTKRATVMNVENILVQNEESEGSGGGGGATRGDKRMEEGLLEAIALFFWSHVKFCTNTSK